MPMSEPNFVMMPDDGAPGAVDQLRRQALRLFQQRSEDGGRDSEFARDGDVASAQNRPPADAAKPN